MSASTTLSPSTSSSAPPAYAELLVQLNRIHRLETIAQLLGWDEQVNLPRGSADLRGEQHAVLAETIHAAASAPQLGELLAKLAGSTAGGAGGAGGGGGAPALGEDERIVVREAQRDYDRATKLPVAFVRAKAAQSSVGFHAWARAREADDFAGYAPVLERNLELAREEAGYLGWGERAYDYMIDKHDPGLSAAVIERLFGELRRELVPLVGEITSSGVKAQRELLRGFPVAAQREFLREVTARLGFDYERGRIDVSLHPFCAGTGADIRMTTRFNEDEPLDSLFSAIHETGHGMYEQGLPLAHHATALGRAAGMGVHESQSRLWENQVGRSRGFWAFFEPRFREKFSQQLSGVSSDALYLAINAVEPTLIRVDADEVTYNLHIILRFEIERRLFSGELAVRDLPEAWRALSRELIGLEPDSDRVGVLQDVHWSDGAFGYFPSYCLGNMLAAQLWEAVRGEQPGIEDAFARGEFGGLLGWLRRNVHAAGKRYDALGLAQRVTGRELSPAPLLRYLRERYLPLYRAG
ncbi:carboxypeptidase [Cephaloticoccus primus]|uniref:Metal-dependent carboxypeptidase n=1 Tax=Cephaloticoccus primus TaxID=1548207 RepID=A0A139SK56_9BACT|nr:carboxypeptidase M32 [Cephaloticoccus primus]KXU34941.1 carboxypeptidase [Cephaloticoccus primus]